MPFWVFFALRSPLSPKFSLPAPSALASDFHIFLGRKARKNEVFVNLLVWRYVLLHVKKLSQRPSGPLLYVSLLSGPHIYRSCIQSSQRHASNRINVRKSGVRWLNVEVDSQTLYTRNACKRLEAGAVHPKCPNGASIA